MPPMKYFTGISIKLISSLSSYAPLQIKHGQHSLLSTLFSCLLRFSWIFSGFSNQFSCLFQCSQIFCCFLMVSHVFLCFLQFSSVFSGVLRFSHALLIRQLTQQTNRQAQNTNTKKLLCMSECKLMNRQYFLLPENQSTLPEAQRTQTIDSVTQFISLFANKVRGNAKGPGGFFINRVFVGVFQ